MTGRYIAKSYRNQTGLAFQFNRNKAQIWVVYGLCGFNAAETRTEQINFN
jgi:hypothetical protein